MASSGTSWWRRADATITGTPAGGDDAILLEREDDLLHGAHIRLQGREVGQEERQPLVPSIHEVANVDRGYVEVRHEAISAGRPRTGTTAGKANEKVEPVPSRESTQIRPPCAATMWRGVARPRPAPPPPPA